MKLANRYLFDEEPVDVVFQSALFFLNIYLL